MLKNRKTNLNIINKSQNKQQRKSLLPHNQKKLSTKLPLFTPSPRQQHGVNKRSATNEPTIRTTTGTPLQTEPYPSLSNARLKCCYGILCRLCWLSATMSRAKHSNGEEALPHLSTLFSWFLSKRRIWLVSSLTLAGINCR